MNETIKEIINAVKGVNEEEKPKAAITLTNIFYNDDLDDAEEFGSASAYNPTIDIKYNSGFVRVDLIFKNSMDKDLRLFNALLENYGKEVNDYDEMKPKIPLNSLTILPIEFNGSYYIVANNSIFWCLQPVIPGEDCRMISILYEEEDFQFFEDSELDIEAIDKIIKEEIESEEKLIEQQILKDEEKKIHEEERNAKIEELRKNRLQ